MQTFFDTLEGVYAAFSSRADGSMKVLPSGENKGNRRSFMDSIGLDSHLIAAEIVHGSKVALVDDSSPCFITDVDALVTQNNAVSLSVTGADCFLVYWHDPTLGVIGIAHAGWRGILAGIIENTLTEIKALGSRVEDIRIGISPGIQQCHFEIQEDILPLFECYTEHIQNKEGKIFIDLPGIITSHLKENGVPPENIAVSTDCTYEMEEQYFSFRRDKREPVEAMMGVITQTKPRRR